MSNDHLADKHEMLAVRQMPGCFSVRNYITSKDRLACYTHVFKDRQEVWEPTNDRLVSQSFDDQPHLKSAISLDASYQYCASNWRQFLGPT